MDIIEQFTYYRIYLNKIEDANILDYLRDALAFGEEEVITTSGNEISYICNKYNNYNWVDTAVDFGSAETNLSEVEDWLTSHIGDFPYYLVFAKNCTWNGHSGYKICQSILDTIYRNYDATFIFKKEIKNGIYIQESSHDVPTGSPTYIIGLTNKEFLQLEDADFDEVSKFVNERI